MLNNGTWSRGGTSRATSHLSAADVAGVSGRIRTTGEFVALISTGRNETTRRIGESKCLLQVPLASVLPFLEGALRTGGEQRRNASVIKSLRRAENLQCREVAIRCRQRCVFEPHSKTRMQSLHPCNSLTALYNLRILSGSDMQCGVTQQCRGPSSSYDI